MVEGRRSGSLEDIMGERKGNGWIRMTQHGGGIRSIRIWLIIGYSEEIYSEKAYITH